MKLLLTRQSSLDMAHVLTGYDGKCRNIPGHICHLPVTVERQPLAGIRRHSLRLFETEASSAKIIL